MVRIKTSKKKSEQKLKKDSKKINWANVLTWSRLVLLIPGTIAVFMGARAWVAGIFAVAALTDAFDGIVARKMGVASKEGALLDSKIDMILLVFLLLWFIVLMPQLLLETTVFLTITVLLIITQLLIAKVKIGEVTGLHLISNKIAAMLMVLTVFLLLLFGDVNWTRNLYYAMLAVGSIAMIEGIIYLLKGGKNVDARSVFFE